MSLKDCSTWTRSCRRGAWLLCTVAGVSLAGCGDGSLMGGLKSYPVKGKVTLPDGKALDSGKVVFAATKTATTSSANIESDGSFTLAGLPEGEYKVRLEVGESTHAKKGTIPFPSKYLDEDGSDLTATVKPDETSNNFDLKLTPNSPRSTSPRGKR